MATKKKSAIQRDIELTAINIVDRERTNWEEAISFITPKVAFRMREMIRILRKNYWGVFDNPIDKNTSREKIWIGAIMATIETWTKNIDLDTKDINFRARTPDGVELTEVTRLAVKDVLDRMYFGETLDADERQVLIDGTIVWKTWQDNSTGKPVLKRKTVDLLNFYIDPTEENIQTAYRVTERGIMVASDLMLMSGWMNTSDAKGNALPGSQVLNRADGSRRSNFGTRTTGDYRDVWECWGKGPKWLLTGDKNAPDAINEVEMQIVVSGLEAPEPTLHYIAENKNKDKFGEIIKPYEEWRCAKISGRWYGLGVAERMLALQEYLNTIVNIRINKHYVSQLGLFKIKKGKGITAQMVSRLTANGGLQVSDMDDIQPLEVPPEDGTSYKDEDVIKYWTQQVTSAMPVSNGEILPASATATANAIANTSAKSAYTLFKEGMGMFVERWLDRGALPIIAKTVSIGDVYRVTEDDENWSELVESVALDLVSKELKKPNTTVPSRQELVMEIDRVNQELLKKPTLFIKSVQDIIAHSVDAQVHITNEDLDTSVTIQNLFQLMQIPPEQRDDDIVKQIYDLMGLPMPKKTAQEQAQDQAQAQQTSGGPSGQMVNPQQQMPAPTMVGQNQQAMIPH